jgi:TPR repeat protein
MKSRLALFAAAAWLALPLAPCFADSFEDTRKDADQGDPIAQFNIGAMYSDGKGVTQDYTEAAKWFRKAADQGDTAAQLNLGIMYQTGRGVPKDDTEAVKWYRKAAELGDAGAQYNLGTMYEQGLGMPRDAGKALDWYSKAALQGNADAQYTLGVANDAFHKDVEAAKWFRKAAEQGDVDAQIRLGVEYLRGTGVPRDLIAAYMWFSLASPHGNKPARTMLSDMGKIMTSEQIEEALKRTREWKPPASPNR